MKLHQDINYNFEIKNPVLTIGAFDGVHIGHRKIIEHLINAAKQTNGESVILTFEPHPQIVLNPDNYSLKLLNTQEEKIELLEKSGIDNIIIIPFTKKFASLSSEEFIKQILVNKIKAKKLIIGYDHNFGKGRLGNFNVLKDKESLFGFTVEEIPARDVENVSVSSTKIRKALLLGDVKTANSYLGYPYFLSGKVSEGNQLGRTIGFPTANIVIGNPYKLIPSYGVYAVKIEVFGKLYTGMLNIGNNPTIGGSELSIEVNIFDFEKNIYNENIRVFLIEKMREEIKFKSLDELKSQLIYDKKTAMKILSL